MHTYETIVDVCRLLLLLSRNSQRLDLWIAPHLSSSAAVIVGLGSLPHLCHICGRNFVCCNPSTTSNLQGNGNVVLAAPFDSLSSCLNTPLARPARPDPRCGYLSIGVRSHGGSCPPSICGQTVLVRFRAAPTIVP